MTITVIENVLEQLKVLNGVVCQFDKQVYGPKDKNHSVFPNVIINGLNCVYLTYLGIDTD